MTEEIKEILRFLSRSEWYKEADQLEDYIINLQQKDFESQKEITKLKDKLEQQRKEYQDTYKDIRIEIKEKNEQIANLQQLYENGLKVNQNENKYRTELEDKYVVLQQENERLKEELKNRPIVDFTYDTYKELENYKSRCEKANKWVDKHTETYTKNEISIIDWDNLSDPRKLKNILNGSDEK